MNSEELIAVLGELAANHGLINGDFDDDELDELLNASQQAAQALRNERNERNGITVTPLPITEVFAVLEQCADTAVLAALTDYELGTVTLRAQALVTAGLAARDARR